jgi:hypothetical protein
MATFFTWTARMIVAATTAAPQNHEQCCLLSNYGTNSRSNAQSTADDALSTNQPPNVGTNFQLPSTRFVKLFKSVQSTCEERQLSLIINRERRQPVRPHSSLRHASHTLGLLSKNETAIELKSYTHSQRKKPYQKAVLTDRLCVPSTMQRRALKMMADD